MGATDAGRAQTMEDHHVSKDMEKNQKTIRDYVGDMVALESHIEEALDRQLKEVKDHPQAAAAVQQFHDMVKHNRDHMKQYQETIGSTGGNPVKAVGSAVLGKAAGIIDMVRSEGVSKSLRDDYTAFNLAAMGYTMLYTTATALNDRQTATICEEHLRGYAEAIQKINHLIPDVVVWELQKDGHQVNPQAASETTRVVDRAWKETDQSGSSMSSDFGMTSQQTPG